MTDDTPTPSHTHIALLNVQVFDELEPHQRTRVELNEEQHTQKVTLDDRWFQGVRRSLSPGCSREDLRKAIHWTVSVLLGEENVDTVALITLLKKLKTTLSITYEDFEPMHDTLGELLYRVITLDTNARATVVNAEPTPAQSLDESTMTVEESMVSLDDAILLQERPATPPPSLPPPPPFVDDNPVAVSSPVKERLDEPVVAPTTEEAKPRRRRRKKKTKKTKKKKKVVKRKRKRKKKIEQMERDENTVSDQRVQQAVVDTQLCCTASLCGPKCCIL